MTRKLILVHGRAQEQKDSIKLKAEWFESLLEGLAKSGLSLPIPEEDVCFPFYGDTLYDLVDGKSTNEAASVVVRGENTDDEEKRFTRALIEEIRTKKGITDAKLEQVAGKDVVERGGPLSWEWFQACLEAIDMFVPYGSGASIALFTHDVYQYLKNSVIRETIESGVSNAMAADVESVVVAHSLGTVVAYNLLRQQGHLRGWKVPLFVTLGSPLAVTEIRKTLRSFAPARCPECVLKWFNAMDERDVVALYPLDSSSFPIDPVKPGIENNRTVKNETSNHHGISGYLSDKEVAKRIYNGLVS